MRHDAPAGCHRRHKLAVWLGLIVLGLVLAGALLLFLTRPGQPVYQGRTLLDWAAQLKSPDSRDRAAAAVAIRSIGPAGLPTLRRALRHGDSLLGRAVEAAEAKLPPKVWRLLYARLRPYARVAERETAARAIAVLGPAGRDALPELAQALQDRKPQVVSATIEALVAIGPESTAVLAARLGTPPTPLRPLQELLQTETQLQILTGLGRIGTANLAIPALTRLLRASTNAFVVQAVANALRQIGPEALPAVLEVMASPDAAARAQARIALGVMVNADLDLLIALTQAFDRQPTVARLEILGVLQQVTVYPRRATLALVMALEDPEPAIRQAAAQWLLETKQPEALERLLTNRPALKQRVHAVFATPADSPEPTPLP